MFLKRMVLGLGRNVNNLSMVAKENVKCVSTEEYLNIKYVVMRMFCYDGFSFLSDTGSKVHACCVCVCVCVCITPTKQKKKNMDVFTCEVN